MSRNSKELTGSLIGTIEGNRKERKQYVQEKEKRRP